MFRLQIHDVRGKINRQPTIAMAVAAIALLIVLLVCMALMSLRPAATPKPLTHWWYYDLNTNALFLGRVGAGSPIDAPSGPTPEGDCAGVRAIVYTCGDCLTPADRVVAYLERGIPPNADEAVGGQFPHAMDIAAQRDRAYAGQKTKEVALPTSRQWVYAASPEGVQLVKDAFKPCPDREQFSRCVPTPGD